MLEKKKHAKQVPTYLIVFDWYFNFQLDGIITREVDPTKSKPKDVTVIDTLSKMMEEGLSLLIKHNDSGNTTVDFFNVTEGTSFGKIAYFDIDRGLLKAFCGHCK